MYYFWTTLLGLIALTWVIGSLRAFRGMARVPRLADATPLPDADCPNVSILVPARDEAEKLPQALPTLLAQDYPRYEVIAVNDRSRDATPQILDEFARQYQNLKVVHLAELPPGWLGKPHAIAAAYPRACGDWLVFTDADVRFAPDLLRRALALVKEKHWDHLTLFGLVDVVGFWEKTAVTYWGLGFVRALEPWQASNPRSRRYIGVGAFQLLRRSTYEAIGTHQRLAREVVDDIKLGKLVKHGGFRSGVAIAENRLRIRWQDGLRNIIRGLTKNAFAASGFRVSFVMAYVIAAVALDILPFLALLPASGTIRALAGVSVVAALLMHANAARASRVSPLYAFTHPLGAAIMAYILLRSTLLTLWRGGVLWRDTFYPLDELKRGLV
ncbi:MAG: glycosyltransferase [Terriglobia bacterium]